MGTRLIFEFLGVQVHARKLTENSCEGVGSKKLKVS